MNEHFLCIMKKSLGEADLQTKKQEIAIQCKNTDEVTAKEDIPGAFENQFGPFGLQECRLLVNQKFEKVQRIWKRRPRNGAIRMYALPEGVVLEGAVDAIKKWALRGSVVLTLSDHLYERSRGGYYQQDRSIDNSDGWPKDVTGKSGNS